MFLHFTGKILTELSMSKKLKASDVKYLVVHCVATPPSMDIGREEIDRWHRQKGWFEIGYHFVIRRDGELEHGRALDTVGAHAHGYNSESLGICLVGGVDGEGVPEDNFTDDQYATLEELLHELLADYGNSHVVGHYELDDSAYGPSFDVPKWLERTDLPAC